MIDAIKLTQKMINNIGKDTYISNIPVYIPSKNRAGRVSTREFVELLNYKIVIEPQDYKEYSKHHNKDKLLVMDKNDMGIAYVRNFIKLHSIEHNNKDQHYHWQLDDDMSAYKVRINNKNIKVGFYKLKNIVETVTFKYNNIALAGLTSSAYAFSKKYPLEINKFPYCNVLINNNTDIWWDHTIKYGDDWDYLLQLLHKGHCTLAFSHLLHENKPMGNNKGGLDYIYAEDVIVKNMKTFIAKYPEYFDILHKPNTNKPYRLKHKKRFFKQFTQQPQAFYGN